MKPSSYHKAEYGDPLLPVRPERCAVEVIRWDLGSIHQCRRRRGYGPEGAYCRQHAEKLYLDNSQKWNERVK
jgi:hypothetical protein